MDSVIVTIDENGDARYLVSDISKGFVDSGTIIQRASNIEPSSWGLRFLFHAIRHLFGDEGRLADWTRQWKTCWRINLTPVGGPVWDGSWEDRSTAIKNEVEWLERNWQ
jgi:hypothetical protein